MTEYEVSKVLDSYINLKEVFKFYGYELNRAGFCRCPFHLEDTGSCKVNDIQFHCFGCDAKGNAVSFVKSLFNLSFKDAIIKINADFGLGLLSQDLTPQQKANIRKRQIDVYEHKQKELELEQLKEEYLQAWKHFVLYKPEEVDYNITTPDYFVDDWFSNVDKRFWEAVITLNMLEADAYIHNFKIDEFEAKMMFTK